MFRRKKCLEIPSASDALPGRAEPMMLSNIHYVNKNPLRPPFEQGLQRAVVALGCFWGAERIFWKIDGVFTTAVGYTAGSTDNPTYDEVCSGQTGHTEAVLVVFDPKIVDYETLLNTFWQSHDPTQGMQQGNDTGTQYRSGIYFFDDAQESVAKATKDRYQSALDAAGQGTITTEILSAGEFYYAEDYHQQYLAKNPGGYCGLGGTGVKLSTGIAT